MPANDPSLGHPLQPKPSMLQSGVAKPTQPRLTAADALTLAKAHFVTQGWRPLAIQSPLLGAQCQDVSAVLLMNGDGETIWLSAREWSALANPVDAFRREMACVRAAKVQETILVYDGEFPDVVIEVAAQEPGLKLVDALALRAMRGAGASQATIAAPLSRRQRVIGPARHAVASLHAHATHAVDTRLLPATERFVSKRLAQTLRSMDGERRKLRNLVTGGLIVMGFAIGFLLFNLVVLIRTPDDATPIRVARVSGPALPAPLPPAEGYVAQAADAAVSMPVTRASVLPRGIVATASPSSSVFESRVEPDMTATAATVPTAGLDDFAVSQMRADEAMRVIADDTPEMRMSGHVASASRDAGATSGSVSLGDPAMVDGDPVVPDPADIE